MVERRYLKPDYAKLVPTVLLRRSGL